MIQTLKKNSHFVWKMTWIIWWILTQPVENLKMCTLIRYFCQKYVMFELKKIQTSCVVKNDLWFQKWRKKFGEFSQQLKVMFDKSSVYVLAEGMSFLDKCSPLNFNFRTFHCLPEIIRIPHVWSYSNSSYDFWNQESVFV